MRYRVQVKRSVQRVLGQLPAPARDALVTAIDGLADNPRPPGTKKLEGIPGLYRLRVASRYRIVWSINDKASEVLVVLAGARKDVYRGLKRI